MRACSFLLWVSLASGMQAQLVVVDTISAVQPWGRHEVYTFPELRMPQQPDIAERIHRDLCVHFLEVDPDTAGNDIFTKVWGDTMSASMPRLNSLSWTCSQVLPGLFTFEFSAEGCGAYCEGFTKHYVYDLRNGERLEYDSLFTAAGLAALNDTVDRRWRKAVNEEIEFLEGLLDVPSGKAIEPILTSYTIDLYRTCLAERPSDHPYVEDMEPRPNGLRVFIARCSAHANMHLDDLNAVELVLPYALLDPMLRVRSFFGL